VCSTQTVLQSGKYTWKRLLLLKLLQGYLGDLSEPIVTGKTDWLNVSQACLCMCVQGSEELFSTEPLPARTPSADSVTHVASSSAEVGTGGSFVTRPRTPIASSLRIDSMRHLADERLDEVLVGGEPEVGYHHCVNS